MNGPLDRVDRLRARTEALASTWGAQARASTTLGRERAILRLFGVHGLDRDGRPLAWSAVTRHMGASADRLARGISLPFAMALLEYDLAPQELALDVASGAVDLELEAELLREPDRRAVAEAEAARLSLAALERIDANRTARRELLGVLGDAPRPWVGLTLREPAAVDALSEAGALVRAGADLLRVEVPIGRELAERLERSGSKPERWRPPGAQITAADTDDVAPSGSQRGVAELRRALDEAAAARHRYVRLATAAPGLFAPEQAVVAGFERVDVVEADPITEIVGGVDPDRALADHSFSHALLQRAGSVVVIGAGPLAVALDIARGVPSDPATRAGRAIALQALGVALAHDDGLSADQVLVGAIPSWLLDERDGPTHTLIGVVLRRALFPGLALAFEEGPFAGRPDGDEGARTWPFLAAASLAGDQPPALVLRHVGPGGAEGAARSARAAVATSAAAGRVFASRGLTDEAAAIAKAVLDAAERTIDALADDGWQSVLGASPEGDRGRLGADAVVERTEAFDPLAPDALRRR